MVDEFNNKLSEYYFNNAPLIFIGYCLPEISFHNKELRQGLYFIDSTFYGVANFSGAKFYGEANFINTTFSDKVYFSGAKFCQEVNFSNTEFIKRAYFRHAQFLGKSIFYDIFFHFRVTFLGAMFGDVLFNDVFFQGKATFRDAHMHKVAFRSVDFQGKALFLNAHFIDNTEFIHTTFGHAVFTGARFKGETRFNHVVFGGGEKTFFDELYDNDVSKVSFMNTDITRVRFSEGAKWGEKEKFKVIEEEWLEKLAKGEINEQQNTQQESTTLESVITVYRNLRENYEYRLRYDEAGKFFIKEMELKRKYTYSPTLSRRFKVKLYELYEKIRGDSSSHLPQIEYKLRKNNLVERNLSLTGLYHLFSKYGESIVRPTIIGVITIALSTLFWLTQADPTKDPSLSKFVGAYWILHPNTNYLERAFERSLADFLPLLSLPSDIKVGVIDYIIKIVGGALSFGLLIIAFRRKFERKYTR